MFTSREKIHEKAAVSGRGRLEYLQALLTEFQDTDNHGKRNIFSKGFNFCVIPSQPNSDIHVRT